jgi:hypothetical protein
MEASATTPEKLDQLLAKALSPTVRLDSLLAGGKEQPKAEAESAVSRSKAKLNEENQTLGQEIATLKAQNTRMMRFVQMMGAVGALLVIVNGCLLVRQSGLEAKEFRRAFEVLHYREARTLQANAIVLAEYSTGLGKIRDQVLNLQGITDEERQVRLRAMNTTITQADNLRDGFIKLVKENDKEQGKGISFEYRDPFLKRPIKFDEELGGEISLDKLRDEVRANAKMDEAMKDLSEAMLNPIPIADQIRAEAKRENAPVVSLGSGTPPSPASQPLQLPGVNPMSSPANQASAAKP